VKSGQSPGVRVWAPNSRCIKHLAVAKLVQFLQLRFSLRSLSSRMICILQKLRHTNCAMQEASATCPLLAMRIGLMYEQMHAMRRAIQLTIKCRDFEELPR